MNPVFLRQRFLFSTLILLISTVAVLATKGEGQNQFRTSFIEPTNQRITNVNSTAIANKKSINTLNGQVTYLQAQIIQYYQFFNNKIDALTLNLSKVNDQVNKNKAAIASTNARIDQLETSFVEVILKLDSINKIWQSNFQVVNKTFAELRKKIKFVVPVFKVVPAFPIFVPRRG